MTEDKRMGAADWNRRYRESPEKWLTPDMPFVQTYEHFVEPAFPRGGRALDLAGGMARHGLYLAERGWDVRVIDISGVALANAGKLAAERGLKLSTEERDLGASADLGRSVYDLIVVFFYLDRDLFPQIEAALKPGGILLYTTYTIEQRKLGKGPSEAAYLLQPEELRRAFPALTVLRYREWVAEKAVAELVAAKPNKTS